MSLFVEDLQATKTFCLEVFGLEVLFEDEASVASWFLLDDRQRGSRHERIAIETVLSRASQLDRNAV